MPAATAMVAPNANQRLHPFVDLLVLTSSTLTAGQTLCANFDSSCRRFFDQ
jgi:hypothetical protein